MAVVVLAIASIEILFFSTSIPRMAVVAAAVFVSVLVSRYEPRISGTQINFSPKDILAFWGVIWIGVSGGVFLAACASLANTGIAAPQRKRSALRVAIDVLAIFFSGIAYYLALGYFDTERMLTLLRTWLHR